MESVPPAGMAPSASVIPPWYGTFRRKAPGFCLAIALAVAAWTRLGGLAAYGFSEDEAAKLLAIESYRQGDFGPNAEHPMLMKLAMWASLDLSAAWNGVAPAALHVAPETALRLPNALAGVATVAALFAACSLLFSPLVGAAASAIVALDPTVTAINRIGKEDTFLVFFFMLAVFLYERGKQVGAADPAGAQRYYYSSAIAWGLMLASKYMPHLFGLYALYQAILSRRPGANRPRPLPYWTLIAATFVAANAAILFRSTWTYGLAYVRGERSLHHGYLYDGELYTNSASVLLYGVPFTYYFHLIATKVPLPVLAAAAAGCVLLVTRRRERGFIWLRVLLVFQILGYSVFASKFQRYALPLLVVLDVLAAAGLVAAIAWMMRRAWSMRARVLTVAAGMTAVSVALVQTQMQARPFYSVHQNAIGIARSAPAEVFPEEAYDYGVREAVSAVAAAAGPGSAIVTDAPLAVSWYLRPARPDMSVRSLSAHGLSPRGEQWVFVQASHTYFENVSLVRQLRQAHRPWREYRLRGAVVLEVYRITR